MDDFESGTWFDRAIELQGTDFIAVVQQTGDKSAAYIPVGSDDQYFVDVRMLGHDQVPLKLIGESSLRKSTLDG